MSHPTVVPTPTTVINGIPLYDMNKIIQLVNRDWVLTNKALYSVEKLIVETLSTQPNSNENIRYMDTPAGRKYMFTEQILQPIISILTPIYDEDRVESVDETETSS